MHIALDGTVQGVLQEGQHTSSICPESWLQLLPE